MWVIRAEFHRILVRIANREDPDQTQSDLGLHCSPRPFWQATSIKNFRTYIVYILKLLYVLKFPLVTKALISWL